MSVIELATVSGVMINLFTLLFGISKLIVFFAKLDGRLTSMETRLTTLERLYDSIEKRKNRTTKHAIN